MLLAPPKELSDAVAAGAAAAVDHPACHRISDLGEG